MGKNHSIPAPEGVCIFLFVLMLRCNLRLYRVSFVFCHERVGLRAGGPLDPDRGVAGNSMHSAGRMTYTTDMDIGRQASVPWWSEAVRSRVPSLGIAVVLGFQMVSLQQQIGDLRTDFHREMGVLRDDLRTEIGVLGERITRLETSLESRAER